MRKLLVAILISILCISNTVMGSTDKSTKNDFQKVMISENIKINPEEGDYSGLTKYLANNITGFSEDTCLISRINKSTDNSIMVTYFLFYMGCQTPYGVSVNIEKGVPVWYYSDVHLFKKPSDMAFGIEIVNLYKFENEFIPSLEKYVEQNCYEFSKNANLSPNITSYAKKIDENNRVYLYFSTEFIEKSQLNLTMRESYKYYLDEHKEDILAFLK